MKLHLTINVPNWLDRIIASPALLYRRLRYGFPFRRIPLTQAKFALVDPDDYTALIKHKWSASKWGNTFYAVRSQGRTQIKMHRQITNAPPHLLVDHRDHNGLNNTKQNLRLCTQSENAKNQRPRNDGSSKFKGVSWNKRDKHFDVRLRYNGRNLYIGSSKSELEAARAYDSAAKFYYGNFACTNFDT
jgi:hypothetical protein